MARLPQLQVRENDFLVRSADDYFGRVLPALLSSRRAQARSLGGRYGVVIGDREWLVDLDNAMVSGDAHSHVVSEADALDAVLALDADAFTSMLAGRPIAASAMRLYAEDTRAAEPLLRLLAAEAA